MKIDSIKSIFFIFLISANAYSMEEDSNKRKRAKEEKSEIAGLSKKPKLESTLVKNETEDDLGTIEQIIIDNNQALEAIQHLDSATAQDMRKTAQGRLNIIKALLILKKLPIEISSGILLLIFQDQIDAELDRHFCNGIDIIFKKTLQSKTKDRVEKYIKYFLIALAETTKQHPNLLIDNVVSIIKGKDYFGKRLSSYFQGALLFRLKNIPPVAIKKLCSSLINSMRENARKIQESDCNNRASYQHSYKFLLDPLIQTLSVQDCKDYYIIIWLGCVEFLKK